MPVFIYLHSNHVGALEQKNFDDFFCLGNHYGHFVFCLWRENQDTAGHCIKPESEVIPTLLLWSQSLPIRNFTTSYTQMLSRDSGIEVGELSQASDA